MSDWTKHQHISRSEWGTLVQFKRFMEGMDTPHKKLMWESIQEKYPHLFKLNK